MSQKESLKLSFVVEAEDLLVQMEDGLLGLEGRPDDAEVLNAIFRAGHTLKGSAGLVEITEIVGFTHVLENVLDRLRKGELAADRPLISALLAGRDVLHRMVARVAAGETIVPEDAADAALGALSAFADCVEPERRPDASTVAPEEPAHRERVFRVQLRLRPDTLACGQDPFMLLLELGDLGELLSVEVDARDLPPFEELDPQAVYLGWRVLLLSRAAQRAVEDVFVFVRGDGEVTVREVMICDHFE